MQDAKIISLIKNGESKEGFQEIYRLFPKAESWLIKKGCDAEEVKDIFQESIIVFYRKAQLNDFELTSSISTYLIGICKNIWYKKVRDKKYFFELDVAEATFNVQEEISSAEITENLITLSNQAISTLGEPCSSILTDFYFNAFSMSDLAKKYGYKSAGVVKIVKFRCLERARNWVKSELKKKSVFL